MEKVKIFLLEKLAALKKAVLIVLLLGLLGGIIFFAYQYVMAEGGEEEFSPSEMIDKVTTAKEKSAEPKKAKAEKTVAMTIPENPFISSKDLSAKAAEKVTSTTTQTVIQSQPPTQMVLPQIPKTQVVQSQPVKLPETRTIVNPMTMETKEVKVEGNVQGVITTNEGKNIAIMSSGEVLTEGERYLDGRIAYIGGDGIEMDNGRKIKLKE